MLAKSCLYQVLFKDHTRHRDSFVFSLLRPGRPLLLQVIYCEAVEINVIAKTPHSRDIQGPGIPGPCMSIIKPALSAQSDFTVAIAAIDWLAGSWLKRHLGVSAALGAYGGKHLASGPVAVATTSIPLCLPCLSARGTALGFIGIALGLKELLFLSGEAEVRPAIGTP